MPRTHKEPLQSHRLGPGPEPEDPPLPHPGAIFALSVVTMEHLTLSRRRRPRPSPLRAGGGASWRKVAFPLACVTRKLTTNTKRLTLREANH